MSIKPIRTESLRLGQLRPTVTAVALIFAGFIVFVPQIINARYIPSGAKKRGLGGLDRLPKLRGTLKLGAIPAKPPDSSLLFCTWPSRARVINPVQAPPPR